MPEPRDRLVREVAAVEPPAGRGVRRGFYQDLIREAAFGPDARRGYQVPVTRSRTQWLAVGENAPPGVSAGLRQRGSPLPAWYPRTPLRDISAIANAMERRRSAQRLALRQRRNHPSELSSPSASAVGPLPQGLSLSETTPVVCDVSAASPLVTASGLCANESSPRTPCDPTITAADDSKLAELETRLEKSIDVIEKAVKENLKRTVKVNDVKTRQRRALMSMR